MKLFTGKVCRALFGVSTAIILPLLLVISLHAQESKSRPSQSAGCKTAYFLLQELADAYENKTGIKILPQRVGNKVAAKLLVAGDIDFAFTCQPQEKLLKALDLKGQEADHWRTVRFAKDPVVVVVNYDNKVTNLSKETLTDIFTGKITNWKEVGGGDREIKLAYQDESTLSGVMVVFREQTVGRKNGVLGELSPNAVKFPGPKKRGAYISQNQGAVTYMGLGAYRERYGKMIDINGAAPTRENIVNGSYPLAATYYIIYDEKDTEMVKPFLDYLASVEGKEVINRNFLAAGE